MRHRIKTAKLGRTGEHRNAMLANMVCSLIEKKEIVTTLAKAKAARVVAEKMVTLGKRGTLHHRRLAASRLRAPQRRFFPRKKGVSGKQLREQWSRDHDVVRILFDEIAPSFQSRHGGYTRIVKLAGTRKGDAAQLAILKWVDESLESQTKPTLAQEKTAEQEDSKDGAQSDTEQSQVTSKPATEASNDSPAELDREITSDVKAVEGESGDVGETKADK